MKKRHRMNKVLITLLFFLGTGLCYGFAPQAGDANWFEDIKERAKNSGNKADLYRVLYYMPKGGDLHNHLSGAGYSQWWYELALNAEEKGYLYYTKIQITDCSASKDKTIYSKHYNLLFRNISENEYNQLNDCVKQQYKELKNLNKQEKIDWLNSIRLDEASEGQEEFFERHWQRLNAINNNPWLKAEILFKNMQAFAEEKISYIEFQISLEEFEKPDGSYFTEDEVAVIFRNRLLQDDAKNTGVIVRFQMDFLRYLPSAVDLLRTSYKFVHDNRDLWVGVNMVGREDNENGHPLRFLKAMHELKNQYSGVRLSIHAGESKQKNFNVRDTLLLGAERIGHGLNLIYDIETMDRMRQGPYLIEINLISNILLNYVDSFQQHPFAKYLRSGIPVALSTDDRGMWDSTMTDEFFVAVTEFDLSWDEIKLLSRNSLNYAFLDTDFKNKLVKKYNEQIREFEDTMKTEGVDGLGKIPSTRGFICKYYRICT